MHEAKERGHDPGPGFRIPGPPPIRNWSAPEPHAEGIASKATLFPRRLDPTPKAKNSEVDAEAAGEASDEPPGPFDDFSVAGQEGGFLDFLSLRNLGIERKEAMREAGEISSEFVADGSHIFFHSFR